MGIFSDDEQVAAKFFSERSPQWRVDLKKRLESVIPFHEGKTFRRNEKPMPWMVPHYKKALRILSNVIELQD